MVSSKTPPSTRERILNYLRQNQTATAAELSRAWGFTKADIRYHLSGLRNEGVVEIIPGENSSPTSRGRPVHTYRIKPHSAVNNFPCLSSSLLQLMLAGKSAQERTGALQSIAAILTQPFSAESVPVQRYNAAISFLNGLAYNARWEASVRGPRFAFRNCPYAAVLHMHPELCELDKHILEQLTQLPVTQVNRINLKTGKPSSCIFTPQQV